MKITSAKDLVDKVLKDIETLTPEEAKTRIEKENEILRYSEFLITNRFLQS